MPRRYRADLMFLGVLVSCGPANLVIDMHAHVVFDETAARAMSTVRPPTPANLIACLQDPRLSHVAAIVIAPRGDPDAVVAQNDALFQLVRENPRLIAVASVHPADGAKALAELARVKREGARMIKLHQNTQGFDLADPAVASVVEEAGRLGLPVMFEGTAVLDAETHGKLLTLAATHPKTRIVVAHMGFTEFAQMLVYKQLEAYPWWSRNVYFDISATVALLARSPFASQLEWTIRTLGVDRVMFGSDFPVATAQETLDAFDTLAFSAEERRAILHDTAARLLGVE